MKASMRERLFAFSILTPFSAALSEWPAFSPPGQESPAEARHPTHESALGFTESERLTPSAGGQASAPGRLK